MTIIIIIIIALLIKCCSWSHKKYAGFYYSFASKKYSSISSVVIRYIIVRANLPGTTSSYLELATLNWSAPLHQVEILESHFLLKNDLQKSCDIMISILKKNKSSGYDEIINKLLKFTTLLS
jgi:hypothetical protein